MMEREALRNKIAAFDAGIQFPDNKQYLELVVSPEKLHKTAEFLRNDNDLFFDYLINLSGVDWGEKLGVTYHMTSTKFGQVIVLKVFANGKENVSVDTVCDIWPTAEYYEREIFDLFGLRFSNHPDLRRLFMPDDWKGHPMRKDYKDDVNIISR